MIALQIARLVTHIVLFLDHTDDDMLDPDAAVQAMEQLGGDLHALDKQFLQELIDAFATIAPEYRADTQQAVRDIPFHYYLEEAVWADNPAKLAELEARREVDER